MSLFDKIFGGGNKTVAPDLTKPYRDLLAGQTDPVVRGVLLRAIASMEDLYNSDSAAGRLLDDKDNKKLQGELAALQQRQPAKTPEDIALSAITEAVGWILIKSAGKVFYGEDMVIREVSGSEVLKKAAMCYAFGLLIFRTLLVAFVQAEVISMEAKRVASGEWKADLLACFALASTEQKIEIARLGGDMFQNINQRSEANVKDFIETLYKLTRIAAINWGDKKMPEEEMLGLFKQEVDVLLGALN